MPTGKKKKTTARTAAGPETKLSLLEVEELTKESSEEEAEEGERVPTIAAAAMDLNPKEPDVKQPELAKPEVLVQEARGSAGDGVAKEPEAIPQTEPVAQEPTIPSDRSPPAEAEGAPVAPSVGKLSEVPVQETPGSLAAAVGEKAEDKPQGEQQAPVAEVKPTGEQLVQGTAAPTGQPAPAAGGGDDFSMFDSQADLEEIFSAMEDVKKDEATAIATAVQALESGQDAATALQSVSTEVAERIQKQLEERTAAEEEHFVTEEEFISHAKASLSKTWYHCLYFLAFKSESGVASKKVLYDALKEPLSKSPVDVLPEHMFNFGLSNLIKVMLYEKPVVNFKRGGEFKLEVKRKKMQELLQQVGPPMSKRPIVTRKEEKKMISDFFNNDKLF